ncbi:hypothetical protein B0I35DRAFT_410940 [Stachybotrys elegans]|uniref:Uncharacterized protein n=1 Tax=Stachybotrys elegans TaxID=80388 RepID=A0A8K0SKB7_9HYPO|nr:hypothetical protein B0I35DRAFT_410940 [Stachybotrys elegans]
MVWERDIGALANGFGGQIRSHAAAGKEPVMEDSRQLLPDGYEESGQRAKLIWVWRKDNAGSIASQLPTSSGQALCLCGRPKGSTKKADAGVPTTPKKLPTLNPDGSVRKRGRPCKSDASTYLAVMVSVIIAVSISKSEGDHRETKSYEDPGRNDTADKRNDTAYERHTNSSTLWTKPVR